MRVLLVDSHVLVRRAFASLLSAMQDIEVVGETGDGMKVVEAAKSLCPDVVLMDVHMPGCNGIEATRRIKQELPQVKVLALTASERVGDLVQVIVSGADGCLLKNATPEELAVGLRKVAEGDVALSPGLAAQLFREFAHHREGLGGCSRANLSPRELEILRLVAQGESNKKISRLLGLNESTVRNHMHNVVEKLHLRNRVQAAIFAARHGLLSSSESAVGKAAAAGRRR